MTDLELHETRGALARQIYTVNDLSRLFDLIQHNTAAKFACTHLKFSMVRLWRKG